MAADVLVELAAVLILAVVAGIAVDECTAGCVRFQDFDQDRMAANMVTNRAFAAVLRTAMR
jgi:hypothetical protein